MWGFLLFTGVAWLAVGWCVLRLEPVDVVGVAAPMVFFAALGEVLRALAGSRAWWVNGGMAALFTAIGVIMSVDRETTPVALVGWLLMVRGAFDVAVSAVNRDVDRTWGVMAALGVAQAGLGFFASGPLFRDGALVVMTLGAVGLLRGLADLVTGLRLREVAVAAPVDVLELSAERAEGVAGYAAGMEDYDELAPRHRATAAHRAAE